MSGLGTPELIVIVVVIMLLFGGKKLPELMKGLGRGLKEFNDAKNSASGSLKE
ncbi:twin-arginine translocase TatA/TatE family subunit [Mucilaginibacter sp. JRF]|uniref:Sec-independent protein translocase subunit TatA/TatB n=1 Tax=Mucilaginibacter sp. JRF TaxID=2780088 RepID=UPI00187E636E|nr:twin-arginine translocase TatA/TatE family subunit [Mucilaginibacter sp. JRF]MBE9583198.1 twin-arginine translocase TatA/TatE family subunit [Mucilaginibacter sp. JRF]